MVPCHALTLDAIKERRRQAQKWINGDQVVYGMRLIKSPAGEPNLAGESVADFAIAGYKAVLDADLVGLTETAGSGNPAGKWQPRKAGAENGSFLRSSATGERTNTVIGRASETR